MDCKVCGKSLFIELDFRTIFKWNYEIHESCKILLDSKVKIDMIPIDNNMIWWIHFFESHKDIEEDYMEMMLLGKGFDYLMNHNEWSTVLWMTQEEYFLLDSVTQFLYLKLNDQSIVFLNLFQYK